MSLTPPTGTPDIVGSVPLDQLAPELRDHARATWGVTGNVALASDGWLWTQDLSQKLGRDTQTVRLAATMAKRKA